MEELNKNIVKWEDLSPTIQTDIIENIYHNSSYLQNNWNIWTFKEYVDDATDLTKFSIEYKNVDDLYNQLEKFGWGISELNVKKLVDILSSGRELEPVMMNGEEFFDGGHRLTAYKRLGRKSIPTINIKKMIDMDWEKWLEGEINFRDLNEIRKIVRCVLSENINRDKSRKVLFIDEHGKNVVYEDNEYRICVDNENDARYITLWHREYVKGIEYWVKRGVLSAWLSDMNFKNRNGKYLSISAIEIEKAHRGGGYGSKMYKALFDFSANDVKGIYSYLPNRINKKEIPKIYNKLGATTDGDYQFIEFSNE